MADSGARLLAQVGLKGLQRDLTRGRSLTIAKALLEFLANKLANRQLKCTEITLSTTTFTAKKPGFRGPALIAREQAERLGNRYARTTTPKESLLRSRLFFRLEISSIWRGWRKCLTPT